MINLLHLLLILIYLSFNIIALVGFGLIFFRLIGVKVYSNALINTIFPGILFATVLIELINIIFPVNYIVSFTYLIIGLCGCIGYWRVMLMGVVGYAVRYKLFSIGMLCITCLWILRAVSFTDYTDLGLYYLTTIKYFNESNIIFGLANLHGRLGFNQSIFLYDALLNFYPFLDFGYAISGLVLIIVVSFSVIRFVGWSKDLAHKIFAFFLFFAIASVGGKLSWGSPDSVIALIQVQAYTLLVMIYADYTKNHSINFAAMIGLIGTLFYGVTVKLSIAAFSVLVIALLIPIYRTLNKSQKNKLLIAALIFFGLSLVHFLRGYLLSGYPLYPSNIFGAPNLSWAVPIVDVNREFNDIYSWARIGNLGPEIIKISEWINPWLTNFPIEGKRYLITSILLGACALLLLKSIRIDRNQFYLIGLLLPLLISVIYWFLLAPDWRFLGAIPDLILGVLSLLIMTQIQRSDVFQKSKCFYRDSSFSAFIIYILFAACSVKMIGIRAITFIKPQKFPIVEYVEVVKSSRLNMNVPNLMAAELCWDSAIPCAPIWKEIHLSEINFGQLNFYIYKLNPRDIRD